MGIPVDMGMPLDMGIITGRMLLLLLLGAIKPSNILELVVLAGGAAFVITGGAKVVTGAVTGAPEETGSFKKSNADATGLLATAVATGDVTG